MITYVSKKVTDRLLSREVIPPEDREIYQFGLEQLFTNMVDVLTLLIIGIFMGMIWQGVVFGAAFMFLRKYAGGFHTSTPLRCYIMTTFVIIVTLSAMKYINITDFIYYALIAASSVVILLLSPIESVNKELDGIEKIIYRRKTIYIWGIETLMVCLCSILEYDNLSYGIGFALIVISISQILEVIACQIRKYRHVKKYLDVNDEKKVKKIS